jgi:hypothetical protein
MSAPSTPGPHPLAELLIERYRTGGLQGPVLEVAAGAGRNTRAFAAAGIPIVATADSDPYTQLPGDRETYAAAFSSHGYLHGAVAKLRAGLAELRRVLRPAAPIAITLGSIRDDRYGFGEALDEWTFAPGDGDEKGDPHAFFERDAIAELLRGYTIESLDEVDTTDIVGAWAHPLSEVDGLPPQAASATDSPQRILHWFVVARKDQ